jgi:transcriptional regulator with XRE-family HTH domain
MNQARDRMLSALGKRISGFRKQRRLTLGFLADKMAISKGNLSDIEAGKRDPRYSTLNAIAHGMDLMIGDLIGERKNSLRVPRRKQASHREAQARLKSRP